MRGTTFVIICCLLVLQNAIAKNIDLLEDLKEVVALSNLSPSSTSTTDEIGLNESGQMVEEITRTMKVNMKGKQGLGHLGKLMKFEIEVDKNGDLIIIEKEINLSSFDPSANISNSTYDLGSSALNNRAITSTAESSTIEPPTLSSSVAEASFQELKKNNEITKTNNTIQVTEKSAAISNKDFEKSAEEVTNEKKPALADKASKIAFQPIINESFNKNNQNGSEMQKSQTSDTSLPIGQQKILGNNGSTSHSTSGVASSSIKYVQGRQRNKDGTSIGPRKNGLKSQNYLANRLNVPTVPVSVWSGSNDYKSNYSSPKFGTTSAAASSERHNINDKQIKPTPKWDSPNIPTGSQSGVRTPEVGVKGSKNCRLTRQKITVKIGSGRQP